MQRSRLGLLGFLPLLIGLSQCTDRSPAANDSGPPDLGQIDLSAADSSKPDAPVKQDRGYPWVQDLGADPDVNLSACREAGAAPKAPDLAAPLPHKPALKWKVTLGQSIHRLNSPVQDKAGNIYVATKYGICGITPQRKVFGVCVKGSTTGVSGSYSMALLGDTLIIGGNNGIAGIKTSNLNKIAWFVPIQGPFDPLSSGFRTSAIAVDQGQAVLGIGDRTLYRISGTGSLKLTAKVPALIFGRLVPLIGKDREVVSSIGSTPSRVISMNTKGAVQWRRAFKGASTDLGVWSVVLNSRSEVIVLSGRSIWQKPPAKTLYKSRITKLDPGCGTVRWSVEVDGSVQNSLIVGHGDAIYGCFNDPLDVKTGLIRISDAGKVSWTTPFEAVPEADKYPSCHYMGPIGADAALHVLVDINRKDMPKVSQVRAYSTAGKQLWSLDLPAGISPQYTSPLLTKAGELVFATEQYEPKKPITSHIVAVQTTSPGMAKTAWPRARHDNQNTSNLATPIP